MKKHYFLKRIISIFFIVLTLLMLPLTSYYGEHQSFCYAVDSSIMGGIEKIILPIAAWTAIQYENAGNTVTATKEQLTETIDNMKNILPATIGFMDTSQKFFAGKMTTNYTNAQLNAALGTSYSDDTVNKMGIDLLLLKIQNNETLSRYEMHKLGVDSLTAGYIKSQLAKNYNVEYDKVYDFEGKKIIIKNIDGFDFYFVNNGMNTILNDFPCQIKGSQEISIKSGIDERVVSTGIYYMNVNEKYFKISYGCNLGIANKTAVSNNLLNSQNIYGLNTTYGYMSGPTWFSEMLFEELNGSTWTKINTYYMNNPGDKKIFINNLYTCTGIDFRNSEFYSSNLSLDNYINLTWQGVNMNFGSANRDFTVLMPTAGALVNQGAPDTSISQAEKIIENVNSQANPISEPYSVAEYPDTNDGDSEIILTPANDTNIGVDTGTNSDVNDTTGDTSVNPETGKGILNIPILGTILSWLKSLVELVRRILEHLLNNNAPTADEGIDWGNFKGLFDIFYIFYYLIIIIIMILIKFLAVVVNLLSIPANAALFNSYPTILVGLNYLKGLKIGGFNITLQQIFEYMFTVFFFLYIVTVLQKLYHSFALIERQTIRQEDRWNDNSNIIYRDGNYINKNTGEIQDYKYK